MSVHIEPTWSHGTAFCPACGNNLDIEDIDFGTCSCCGGEGWPEDDQDDLPYWPGEHES